MSIWRLCRLYVTLFIFWEKQKSLLGKGNYYFLSTYYHKLYFVCIIMWIVKGQIGYEGKNQEEKEVQTEWRDGEGTRLLVIAYCSK